MENNQTVPELLLNEQRRRRIMNALAIVARNIAEYLGPVRATTLVDDPELVEDARQLGADDDGFLPMDEDKSIGEWKVLLRAAFPELTEDGS